MNFYRLLQQHRFQIIEFAFFTIIFKQLTMKIEKYEVPYDKRIKTQLFTKFYIVNHQQISSYLLGTLIQTIRMFTGQILLSHICLLETELYIPVASELKIFIQSLDYQSNSKIYQIIGILVLVINILYIIYYLLPTNKTKKLSLQVIINLCNIIFRALNQFINIWLSIGLYGSYNSADYVITFLFFISIVSSLICWKFTVLFQRKNQIWSIDYNIHRVHFSSVVVQLGFSIFTIIAIILQQSGLTKSSVAIGFILLFMILWQVLKLKLSIIDGQYQQRQMKIVYNFTSCFEIVSIFAIALYFFFGLKILGNNILVFDIFISIFMWWAIQNYDNWQDDESYFWQMDQIKSSSGFYRLMNSYYRLYKTINQETSTLNSITLQQSPDKSRNKKNQASQSTNSTSQIDLVLSSMRKSHENKCQLMSCFCKDQSLNYNPKQFLRQYIIEQLKQFKNKFYHNLQIQLYIIEFGFHIFGIYQNIKTEIKILQLRKNIVKDENNKKQNSFLQSLVISLHEYTIFALQLDVEEFLLKRNKQNRALKVQLLLKLEVTLNDLKLIINNDIETKHKKWLHLSKSLCRIQQLQALSDNQLYNLQKIFTIYGQNFQQYNRSSKFNLILLFYYGKIIQKFDIQAKLLENIKLIVQKFKPQQLSNLDVFNKMIFNPKCCILMSLIDQNANGPIFNASRTVENVFGYTQKKIIGESIDLLVPQFMKTQHKQIFKNWIDQDGNWKKIAKIYEIYCQNKQKQCFSAFKYMKIIIHQNGLYFLTTVFKKNDTDIILINLTKNRIQSAGKKFISVTGRDFTQLDTSFIFQGLDKLRKKSIQDHFKQDNIKVYDQKARIRAFRQQKQSFGQQNQKQSARKRNEIMEQLIQKLVQEGADDYWDLRMQYKSLRINKEEYLIMQIKHLDPIGHAEVYVKQQTHKDIANMFSKQSDNLLKSDENLNKTASNKSLTHTKKKLQNNRSVFQQSVSDEQNENGQHNQINAQLQQKSSMVSSQSSVGLGLYKLIEIFSQYFYAKRKLNDVRQNVFIVTISILCAGLITILVFLLEQNQCSLSQKSALLTSKTRIDLTFNMFENLQSDMYSLYEFQKVPTYYNQFLGMLTTMSTDFNTFNNQLKYNFESIINAVSPCNGRQLYDFIKIPIIWYFNQTDFYEVELLQYFKLMHQLAIQMAQMFSLPFQQRDQDAIKALYKVLIINTPKIRLKRMQFLASNISQMQTQINNNQFILFGQLALFTFLCILTCFLIHRYSWFRFDQKIRHLNMYLNLSLQQIQKITAYYEFLYNRIKVQKESIDQIYQNQLQSEPILDYQNKKIDERVPQQQNSQLLIKQNKPQSTSSTSNKIVFIGRSIYKKWILHLLGLIICITVNSVIIYEVDLINRQITYITGLINLVSQSFSLSIFSFNKMQGVYYFDLPNMTSSYLDDMLKSYKGVEVNFDSNTSFAGNYIINGDTAFWKDFNGLLLGNLCDVNRYLFPDDTTYQWCIKQGVMSNNGIVIFANYFQRLIKNVLLQLRNLAKTNQQNNRTNSYGPGFPQDLYAQDRFRQANLITSSHIPTITKLNDRIVQAYSQSFNSLTKTCQIMLIFLIIKLSVVALSQIFMYGRQKKNIQRLYGYIFLMPLSILKSNKYVLKFISQNLEFSEKY